ncbi:MAG: Nif11-like leader peptide family RiPP precursor [Schwartzia sp.]|nr:Nif11-like leader peptide family RiPP precursor [Schwartzia sp. (in: firmicutes)]
MANINENEITQEQIAKAMACETAEELIAAAKEEGYDITREEAEAYLAELADFELDDAELTHAAGGACWDVNGCSTVGHGPCPGNDCATKFNPRK